MFQTFKKIYFRTFMKNTLYYSSYYSKSTKFEYNSALRSKFICIVFQCMCTFSTGHLSLITNAHYSWLCFGFYVQNCATDVASRRCPELACPAPAPLPLPYIVCLPLSLSLSHSPALCLSIAVIIVVVGKRTVESPVSGSVLHYKSKNTQRTQTRTRRTVELTFSAFLLNAD